LALNSLPLKQNTREKNSLPKKKIPPTPQKKKKKKIIAHKIHEQNKPNLFSLSLSLSLSMIVPENYNSNN
jgi:hypothetical protein